MLKAYGTQVSVIAFRVEAGGSFGSGHLVRSLALAEELVARAAVRFVVSAGTAGVDQIRSRGFAVDVVEDLSGERAVGETAAVLRAAAVATLVTDFDGISPAYLAGLRAELPELAMVCLDDLSVPPGTGDLLIRPHAVKAWWPAVGPGVLLGPRYWILREAFDALVAAPRPPVPERAGRLLVMLGGAAPGARLAALVRALAALQPQLLLDVIAGPLGDQLGEIERAMAELGGRATLHVAPPELPAMMARADLAVVAAGYSLYELCALGTPTLALALVEHQRVTLEALARAGCVLAARATPADDFAGLAAEVSALVDDRAARAALSRAGQALVDGRGRARVAAQILERSDERGRERGGERDRERDGARRDPPGA